MGEADPVQKELLFFASVTLAGGAVVPATTRQRGFGVLTQVAAGNFEVNLNRGVDNIQTAVVINRAENLVFPADGAYVWDKAGSTDTLKRIRCQVPGGAAQDNIDFTVSIYAILTP